MSPGRDAQPSASSAAILRRLRPSRDRTGLRLAAVPSALAGAAWAIRAAAGAKGGGGLFSIDAIYDDVLVEYTLVL
jgi:hypothetical protein